VLRRLPKSFDVLNGNQATPCTRPDPPRLHAAGGPGCSSHDPGRLRPVAYRDAAAGVRAWRQPVSIALADGVVIADANRYGDSDVDPDAFANRLPDAYSLGDADDHANCVAHSDGLADGIAHAIAHAAGCHCNAHPLS
jgi:hypothetical protein